jgi:16S rRNA (guanine966-N2)-methyltransferase
MRIISGIAGGIRLRVPKGRDTRPTTDRVRESMFATLGDLTDLVILDLYAGTGALGLEALSRGAKHCTFVESGGAAIPQLEHNIQTVLRQWPEDYTAKPTTTLLKAPVERVLPRILRTSQIPNIIFADPPYRDKSNAPTARFLLTNPDIADTWPDALLVLEHETNSALPWSPQSPWTPVKQKHYGSTTITIARAEVG